MKKIFLTMLLAVLPALGGDLTGTWNFELDIAGMLFKPVMELKHEGASLTGSVKMPGEEAAREVKGTVDGEAVKLEYDTEYEGQTYHLVYTGKLDGDGAMKGDVDATAAQGAFTAKKAANVDKPA